MTYEPDNKRYFALALDPIHVGTGGYRLGRVDMNIVREPGTNVPKIPGTSLSGACRTYATMQHPKKWPHCAGQGQPDAKRNYNGHCGKPDCPICVTFGFSKGNNSFQGLAQFSDAQLVLFPVYSLAGPVWITCPEVLQIANGKWVNGELKIEDGKVRVANGVFASDGNSAGQRRLNLGWLMLDAETDFSLSLPNVPPEILNRAVLVSNKLFSQIVNDNLEVRTSVSIDPNTGAAADGALFTYEALPRASVLAFEVIVSDPQFYKIQGQELTVPVRQTVESGLRLFESLGVGGMNTRGMGRLKVLELDKEGGGQ